MIREKYYFLYCVGVILWCFVSTAYGQKFLSPSEIGIPFPSEHYNTQEFGYLPHNWDVTQDHRGMLYVANTSGVLEFDGTAWRLITATTSDTASTSPAVRSLATGPAGTVYVGADGDFGLLQPDSLGVQRYVSLLRHVPEPVRIFEDVWTVEVAAEAVFFQTRDHLFRWHDGTLETWTSDGGFHTAFAVGDRFFVRDFQHGLLEWQDGSLQVVPGGEAFEETPVYLMERHPDGRILIGTSKDGFYLYDGTTLTPHPTEADAFLRTHSLYHGCALPGGFYALATLGGGVVVIDADGSIVQKLSPSAQLPDGVVNYVYVGREGELWMAFNNSGVMRADVLSPRSMFDESLGLAGIIRDIERHNGRLYVATGRGLYTLEQANLTALDDPTRPFPSFRKVPGIPIAFDLQVTPFGLLVATQRGVFRLVNGRATRLTSNTTFDFSGSPSSSENVVVGTRDGVSILQFTGDGDATPVQWTVEGIETKVTNVQKAPDGSLWLSVSRGRVLHLRFSNGHRASPVVEEYGPDDGLAVDYNMFTRIDDEIVILSRNRVLRVKPVAGVNRVRFVPDSELMPGSKADGALEALHQTSSGEMWALRGNRVYTATKSDDGTIDWTSVAALHFPKTGVSAVRVESDGIVWISDANRLIRYDPGADRARSVPFAAYVRQVTAITDGMIVYGGTGGQAAADEGDGDATTPYVVPFARNDLSFDVSAPLFNVTSPNEYQVRLEGRHDTWTAWKEKPSVVYTNLAENTYRFHVRARNERGAVSDSATFVFRVVPPWYRTRWAYGLYGIGFILVGFAFRKYYLVMEENERQRERTQHLERERLANERLQRANRRLRQANELKENFLASTSHELRTPLTNILGFSDIVREETTESVHDYIDVIEVNGRRLLRTLDALLELASLRAGEVNPSIGPVNVTVTVRQIACEFDAAAAVKGVDLVADVPRRPVYALLDARYLEQILRNLIDNAIKFTDEGSIHVAVRADARQVEIDVSDTGIGIDSSFMPDLFRDFKQESQGLARAYEGSGLGLAITARLVELMKGSITVKSEKGEGSTFSVSFPRHRTVSQSVSREEAIRPESGKA